MTGVPLEAALHWLDLVGRSWAYTDNPVDESLDYWM
jgi:hypothetical protein